jgi:hypothetical protein
MTFKTGKGKGKGASATPGALTDAAAAAALCLLLLILPPSAQGQPQDGASGPVLGLVDLGAVVDGSIEGKDEEGRLWEEYTALMARISEEEEALAEWAGALSAREEALQGDPARLASEGAGLEEDKAALQRDVEAWGEMSGKAVEEFKLKETAGMESIRPAAWRAAGGLAKDRGLGVLVDACDEDPVLYDSSGQEWLDVTDAALEAMDAAPAGSEAPPGAWPPPGGGAAPEAQDAAAPGGGVAVIHMDGLVELSSEGKAIAARLQEGAADFKKLEFVDPDAAAALGSRLNSSHREATAALWARAEKLANQMARDNGWRAAVKACRPDSLVYSAPGVKALDVTPLVARALDAGEGK